MAKYADNIELVVIVNLGQLSWKCSDCMRLKECEDDGDNIVSRYCLNIIKAAIKCADDFEIPHPIE